MFNLSSQTLSIYANSNSDTSEQFVNFYYTMNRLLEAIFVLQDRKGINSMTSTDSDGKYLTYHLTNEGNHNSIFADDFRLRFTLRKCFGYVVLNQEGDFNVIID